MRCLGGAWKKIARLAEEREREGMGGEESRKEKYTHNTCINCGKLWWSSHAYIHTGQYDLLFIMLTALALDLDPLATTTLLCLNAAVADPYSHISSNPLLISLMEANPTCFRSWRGGSSSSRSSGINGRGGGSSISIEVAVLLSLMGAGSVGKGEGRRKKVKLSWVRGGLDCSSSGWGTRERERDRETERCQLLWAQHHLNDLGTRRAIW
jgi:hypothetical protein